MPNTDREEIKSQQRRLNKLRSLRNRIEAKERSLKQDEIQWDAWLKEIKESIHTQKKKHEEAQERMELELHNLRKEEEDLKNGVEDNEEQMEEEEDLEQQLEQLMDGKQSKKQMDQKALQAMKKEMEAEYQIRMAKEREMMQHEFQKMLHHTLALHATTSGTPTPTVVDLESADTKMEGQQDVPTSGQTMTSAAAKAALVPFGVARRAKGTTVTSPYGRRKDQEDLPTEQKDAEEQRMEEILKNQPTKEELKEASTEELETGANPDTGQRWAYINHNLLSILKAMYNSFGEARRWEAGIGQQLQWLWCFFLICIPLSFPLARPLAGTGPNVRFASRFAKEDIVPTGRGRMCLLGFNGKPNSFSICCFITMLHYVVRRCQICFTLRWLRRTIRFGLGKMATLLCNFPPRTMQRIDFLGYLPIYKKAVWSITSCNGILWRPLQHGKEDTSTDVPQNISSNPKLREWVGWDGVPQTRKSRNTEVKWSVLSQTSLDGRKGKMLFWISNCEWLEQDSNPVFISWHQCWGYRAWSQEPCFWIIFNDIWPNTMECQMR